MAEWSSQDERVLARLVEQHISSDDVAHAYDHVHSVARLTRWLCRGSTADERVAVAAAWCHDLRSRQAAGFKDATARSADAASLLLRQLDFDESERSHVSRCIRTASWEHHLNGGEPSSPEAEVLRDADWLDAMGAHGIARVFAFAGTYGVPLRFVEGDPSCPVRLRTSDEQADPSPFHHFYSKLLWLHEGLRTPKARVEGRQRHDVLVRFLHDFQQEIERTHHDES